MTAFRGFTIESKSYYDYETLPIKEKVLFWMQFPFAWMRFISSPVKETIGIVKQIIKYKILGE